MNRKLFVLVFSLAIAVVTEAQAGKKLYVGNLPFSATDAVVVDTSTTPATPVLDTAISLRSPPQQTKSSLTVVNPDAGGLGDSVDFDVFFDGSPGDFPASSFFDVFVDISDPNTGQPVAMKKGTVKFFNETKGFGFVVDTQPPTIGDQSLGFTGQINRLQSGLSFGDVQTFQPSPIDPTANSFFDIFTELKFDGTAPIDPSLPLFTITMTTAVPEPSTIVLGVVGLVSLLLLARKNSRRS